MPLRRLHHYALVGSKLGQQYLPRRTLPPPRASPYTNCMAPPPPPPLPPEASRSSDVLLWYKSHTQMRPTYQAALGIPTCEWLLYEVPHPCACVPGTVSCAVQRLPLRSSPAPYPVRQNPCRLAPTKWYTSTCASAGLHRTQGLPDADWSTQTHIPFYPTHLPNMHPNAQNTRTLLHPHVTHHPSIAHNPPSSTFPTPQQSTITTNSAPCNTYQPQSSAPLHVPYILPASPGPHHTHNSKFNTTLGLQFSTPDTVHLPITSPMYDTQTPSTPCYNHSGHSFPTHTHAQTPPQHPCNYNHSTTALPTSI